METTITFDGKTFDFDEMVKNDRYEGRAAITDFIVGIIDRGQNVTHARVRELAMELNGLALSSRDQRFKAGEIYNFLDSVTLLESDGHHVAAIDYAVQFINSAVVNNETLRKWGWVARNIPQKLRYFNISFSHYEAVARMGGDEHSILYWLGLAETDQIDIHAFRAMIRAARMEEEAAAKAAEGEAEEEDESEAEDNETWGDMVTIEIPRSTSIKLSAKAVDLHLTLTEYLIRLANQAETTETAKPEAM